jgi:hypothetical protein
VLCRFGVWERLCFGTADSGLQACESMVFRGLRLVGSGGLGESPFRGQQARASGTRGRTAQSGARILREQDTFAWQGWGEAASLSVSSSEHVFERLRRSNPAPAARRSNLCARDSFGSRRREGERAELKGPPVCSSEQIRPSEPRAGHRRVCFFGGALESVRNEGRVRLACGGVGPEAASFGRRWRESCQGLEAGRLEASRPARRQPRRGLRKSWRR